MAITYVIDPVQANTQNVASSSLTVAVNDVILVLYSNEDNGNAGTLSIAKSAGTSTVSAFTNIATTATNNQCKSVGWFCTVTGAGTFTVTVSKTGTNLNHSLLATIVHTGVDTSNPCPSGNRFSGIDTNGDTTQSITPTSSGSALWFIAGDWNATNTFAAAANCTLANTYHSAGAFTATVIRPTTQPRTDANAFTIGESDTGATIAWVACEVKAAAASGSTGTVAVTNANDTLSAAGTTTVIGSLSRTNANDTSAASGATTIIGTLARTNANDTLSASGSVGAPVTGTLAYTNVNDTLSANGTTTIIGSLARTNSNDTLSAAGTTTILGTLVRTNANDTLSANGSPIIVGTLARTNANDTLVANGSVGSAVSGSLAVTNANDTLASNGTTTIIGSLARTNANDTISASGSTIVNGALARTNANDTLVSSGSSGSAVSGTLVYTNINDSLAATGTTTIVGSLARTNNNDTSVANGTTTVKGALSNTNANDTLSSSGIEGLIAGTVSYTNENDTLSANGDAGQLSAQISGHGGYPVGIYYQDKPKRKIKRKKLDDLLDSAIEEYYAEIIDKAPKVVKNKAAKIVKPYSEIKRSIPNPSAIYWQELKLNTDKLKALKELYLHEINLRIEEEMAINSVVDYERELVFTTINKLINSLRGF